MKKTAAVLLCAVLFISGCSAYDAVEYEGSSESVSDEEAFSAQEPDECAENTGESSIFIYICGAVSAPGVYELPAGSRIYEAVEAAGGLNGDADVRTLNQARLLTDGEQITVYTEAEIQETGGGIPENGGGDGTESDDGLVNINTADAGTLMTLPGIGESRAEAIIAYREEAGAFKTPQEICNVTGIKEKLYARIENLIKV